MKKRRHVSLLARGLALAGTLVVVTGAGCASQKTQDGPGATEPAHVPADVANATSETTARAARTGSFDPAQPLSLDRAVEVALGSSLNARTFKARLEAAKGAAVAASSWPNPSIEYTAEDIGLVFDHQRQILQQELVSYPILAVWTKFLENEVADAELARAQASVEDDKRLLRLSVGQSFLELLATDEAVRNLTETAKIATKLAEAAATRARVGDASALDRRRAETEALEARRDLTNAILKRETDGIAFALALGAEKPFPLELARDWPLELPADVAAEASTTTAGSSAALIERAYAARADLRQAEAALLRASKSAEVEGRKSLPLSQWTLGVGAREGPQGYGAVVVLGTQLPVFDWNGGNKTRTRAELEQAALDLERTRRQIAFDVEASVATLNSARRSLDEFARPIAQAREQALEDTRRLFAAGELGYVELLQAQRDAVAARRDLVDSEKDAALARWKLLVALGR